MATVQQEFRQWLSGHEASDAAAVSVQLLRMDEGAPVLRFARPAGRCAELVLRPVEGSSFFAEGVEDLAAELEEWLAETNSSLAERPTLTLAEALTALARRMPRSSSAQGGKGACEDDEDMELEDEDDDMLEDVVEAAEERETQRAALLEERHWDAVVDASASQGSRQASQVLMREMRALQALEGEGSAKALQVEMVNDSLYLWRVTMHVDGFPDGCALKDELAKFARQHPSGLAAVVMEVAFPDGYPMAPPFIRVVRPRFQMHTGHVTIGGSICMQLLTPSGWLPSVSLETVFVSIRSEMIEGRGRLDPTAGHRDYTSEEAREAFNRVAMRYGWLKV